VEGENSKKKKEEGEKGGFEEWKKWKVI